MHDVYGVVGGAVDCICDVCNKLKEMDAYETKWRDAEKRILELQERIRELEEHLDYYHNCDYKLGVCLERTDSHDAGIHKIEDLKALAEAKERIHELEEENTKLVGLVRELNDNWDGWESEPSHLESRVARVLNKRTDSK